MKLSVRSNLSCLQYKMFLIFRAFFPVLFLIGSSVGEEPKKFIKPSFAPYCNIKDNCKSACSCKGPSDCTLMSMSDAIRKSIVYYYNRIRQIQTLAEPEPSGMTMLEYDMQLEEVSACFALLCESEHSTCFFTPKFPETSQSVFQIRSGSVSSEIAWVEILNRALGENNNLSADSINVLPGGKKGDKLHNYAQLVGDNIRYIGCAWSLKQETQTFVCTYGPRGPVWGEPIYKRGDVCTTCPEEYACEKVNPFSNLCKRKSAISTSPPVETPPPPPPLPPVKAPPGPPPLAVSRGPLSPPTRLPHPPPVPPERPCPGDSNCDESYSELQLGSSAMEDYPGKQRQAFGHPRNAERFRYSQGVLPELRGGSTNHIRLHQNNPPLVPLRNIPHSRLLSSSLISQPSLPIRSRLSSAIGRSKSRSLYHIHPKPSRLMETIESEPSQLVPSYQSKYDSLSDEREEIFPAFDAFKSESEHEEGEGEELEYDSLSRDEYNPSSQLPPSRQKELQQDSFYDNQGPQDTAESDPVLPVPPDLQLEDSAVPGNSQQELSTSNHDVQSSSVEPPSEETPMFRAPPVVYPYDCSSQLSTSSFLIFLSTLIKYFG